MQRDPAPLLR